MASTAGRNELFFKHEGSASGIPPAVWYFLGPYVVEDRFARDAVWTALFAVSSLRALCWRAVSWERYLGMESTTAEGYTAIGSLDFELPILTMPERLSVWLIPIGYLSVWSIGMEAAVAHAFSGGVAASIASGVLYRRVRNVELMFRASGH